MSFTERAYIRDHNKELKESGKLRDSSSPHATPVLTRKKDGTLRMVVDYRRLNKYTIPDKYAMPLIDAMIDALQGSKIYILIDLRNVFHQVLVRESNVPRTAFRTMDGHFEWLVMPFGLTNAPSSYQRLLDKVLALVLYKCAVCYIDDILVHSKSPAQHLINVRRVLSMLRKEQLYAKISKCHFGFPKVIYLGHCISFDDISPDPVKLKAIREWPIPTTSKDVQWFLGMATYLRRFVPRFSNLSAPLTDLTKEKVPFLWTLAHQSTFDRLKGLLCEAPVLALSDPLKSFTLATNASTVAVGAVLFQSDEAGLLHPVVYHGRKLKPVERNYAIHDLEMLAIVDAIKHWRHYPYGLPFVVWSDHVTL
jgi:hypothetical protein